MFPAALVDCLVAYLSLLYPAESSSHKAISASDIVLTGDSSGGNICIAMVQVILQLRRQSPDGVAHVIWSGRERELPLPAGVAAHSAFLDLTRSLPSETSNLQFDLIPSPKDHPFPSARYTPSPIWPTSPKRESVYASDEMLLHPLVSLTLATNWENCSTKLWLSVGEECLADGNFLLASHAARSGMTVQTEQYLGMPHDFATIFANSVSGRECLTRWAGFINACVARDQSGQAGPSFVRVHRDGNIETDSLPLVDTNDLKKRMVRQVQNWKDQS